MFVSRLTDLQRDVLHEFFRREQRFFLTGGAALAGYHLGHRETDDLDLFSTENVLEDGRRVLEDISKALNLTVRTLSDSPTHKRFELQRGQSSLKVDLVYDPRQLLPKVEIGGVGRFDPIEEIAANKLCTLLSRSEIRDLVDLQALEKAGAKVEDALPRAMQKDGGLTAATLLEVVSQIRIGEAARLPGDVPAVELRRYLSDLMDRLARLAYPQR